ncbi:ADP-ribosylglycohydrolase family protein [Flavivirga algicola]|uniref:ADP-ribosylglycohydrolase family protein n=1 Tax=Flavivirga algicola TaxID=2729136 RepID=A0ABX1S362_9FLAO|nr:ADP-ribosylglycohydrolase family protein [Flavivirga algicola]NMH88975.1 ADP-ribosylglycohydrolase family protein [Flavivirga algicola]
MRKNKINSALFGLAVGDALGVPVEFKDRDYLKRFPVTGMLEYGTHAQPLGTWSDDSSLAFCLAESLCRRYDINDIGQKFVQWRNEEIWTPHGSVFDIGISTNQAIHSIETGTKPILAGGRSEMDNGNGSLMRILPLIFYIKDFKIEKRFDIIKDVSSITHAHIRSVLACFIYLEYALNLLNGKAKWDAYKEMQIGVNRFLNNNPICSQNEMDKFHKILENRVGDYQLQVLHELDEGGINAGGYVLDSLEASLWCILTSENYKESVLKAVNLGKDTDTTAAITGGLAGLLYGYNAIPDNWVHVLSRREDIEKLCDELSIKYNID